MTLEELRERLLALYLSHRSDPESCHAKSDDLLLEYINDDEVNRIWSLGEKWCA